MIRPPGFRGAVFSSAADGDLRGDLGARRRFARTLGISGDWATVAQVHGSRVLQAHGSGELGAGDGIFTLRTGLPIAVFAADCVPVVVEAATGVGVAHAGWRGLAAGVITALRQAMEEVGAAPERAAVGPSIGPCCYEVGDDVLARLGRYRSTTTWGTISLDLWAAAADQLEGLPVSHTVRCTHHEGGFSHRLDGTEARQATVAWMR